MATFNSPNKKRVDVIIDGKVYNLASVDSEEHIHAVAKYIDEKIKEICEASKNIIKTSPNFPILLAINIADDLFKQISINKLNISRLKKTESLTEEIKRLKVENAKLKSSDTPATTTTVADANRLNEELYNAKSQLAEMQARATEKDKAIATLKASVAERDRAIATLKASVAERDKAIATLKASVAERDKAIATLKANITEKDKTMAGTNATLEKTRKELEETKKEFNEYIETFGR